jgi:hypothetical protein
VPARAVSTALASVAVLAALVLVALVLIAPSAAAVDAGSSLRITFLPQKAFRGQAATLAVAVRPAGVRCTGGVVYADGRKQVLKPTNAKRGRTTWKWQVPLDVKLGGATVSLNCRRAGSVSRVFVVTGRPTEPARVEVEKQGFSQRVKIGPSREVSYGVVLRNVSPANDALNVAVHVNMLDATGVIRRTTVRTVGTIGAQANYYFGGGVTIPEHWIPISTLEIKITIGSQQEKALRTPELSDHRIVAAQHDPGWVSTVFFQALNDEPLYVFSNASVSAVVFDAAGGVIGGGTGFGLTALRPGIRAQYDASAGLSAIPLDRAVSAGVSVLGSYARET